MAGTPLRPTGKPASVCASSDLNFTGRINETPATSNSALAPSCKFSFFAVAGFSAMYEAGILARTAEPSADKASLPNRCCSGVTRNSALSIGAARSKYAGRAFASGTSNRTPGSPPLSGPSISCWKLVTACGEFQRGAQKIGISAAGRWLRAPSIENASGESRSCGGRGSCTSA